MMSIAWDSQNEEEDNEIPSSQAEDDLANRDQVELIKQKIVNGYVPQIPTTDIAKAKVETNKSNSYLNETQESQVSVPLQVIYEQDDMNFNLDCASQQPSQTLTNYLGEKPSVNNIEHILDQVIEKDEQPPTPEKWAYQLSQTNYSQELKKSL